MSWLDRNATTMWEWGGEKFASREHFGEAKKMVFQEKNK